METKAEGSVMVVDDDRYLLESLSVMLRSHGFEVCTFTSAAQALQRFAAAPADVVITDISMPQMDGVSFTENLRVLDPQVPVIFMTGTCETSCAHSALRLRVFDVIVKPFAPALLVNSLHNALQQRRLLKMEQSYRQLLERAVDEQFRASRSFRFQQEMDWEMVRRMAAAAEFREEATGGHLNRMGLFAGTISEALGMSPEFVEDISLASILHDIGKIGIPESILLKTSPLTREEFLRMQSHTLIGDSLLKGSSHPTLRMAAAIALNHHERWDGSGYPNGLAGEDIPLPGRIVMLADQYDVLRSRRAYKEPRSHADVVDILGKGDGRTMPGHFDPRVLAVFREIHPQLEEIFSAHPEEHVLAPAVDDEGEGVQALRKASC
jgi:putative two-component system response regulator